MAVETRVAAGKAKQFWDDFAANGWEKKPMLLRDPAVRLDIPPDELFRGILLAAQTVDKPEGEGPRLRFYIDRRMVAADLAEVLPREADGSVAGYVQRIEAELSPHEWMLFIDQIHTVSFEIWSAARDFIRGFVEVSHLLPAGPSDVDVFLGHYGSTPGGIHADPCGNFMFTVYGTKGMRLWPPEAGSHLPQKTRKYESVREQGELFTGDQSTVVYFPGRHYHVGESAESASVSVNVALFLEDDPIGKAFRELRRRTQRKVSIPRRTTYDISSDGTNMPEGYEQAVEAMTQAMGDGSGIVKALHAAWLRRITSYGFESLPPVATVKPVADASRVSLSDTRYPVLYRTIGDELVVCANGRSASIKPMAGVEQGLELLNRGREVAVNDLYRFNLSGNAEIDFQDLIKALVWRLYSWRAVKVMEVQT